MRISRDPVDVAQARQQIAGGKKRSKYRAVPTVAHGIAFDSKAEAARYGQLLLLAKAGKIENLRVHPRYELIAASTTRTVAGAIKPLRTVGFYEADFSYYDTERRVEDVKGFDTPLSKWKRKHVKAQYGIDVTIVRMR